MFFSYMLYIFSYYVSIIFLCILIILISYKLINMIIFVNFAVMTRIQ